MASIFPKTVKLILRGQSAYIVSDDKQMKSAVTWARGWGGEGEYSVVEYENGNFKVEIDSAAGDGSNSGKLAFWRVKITAPDGKVYHIGINADNLCLNLKETTCINGKFEDNVYIGRVNGQQAFCLKDSALYKQSESEQKLKNTVSILYKVGDVIETLTNRLVYLGETFCHFDFDEGSYWQKEFKLDWFNKPKKCYEYVSLSKNDDLTKEVILEKVKSEYHCDYFKMGKVKGNVIDNVGLSDDEILKIRKDNFAKNRANVLAKPRQLNYNWLCKLKLCKYSLDEIQPSYKESIIDKAKQYASENDIKFTLKEL